MQAELTPTPTSASMVVDEPVAPRVVPTSNLMAAKGLSASLDSLVQAIPSPRRITTDECVLGQAPHKPQRGVKRPGTRPASMLGDDEDSTSHKSFKLDTHTTPREALDGRSVSYCGTHPAAPAPATPSHVPVPPGKLGSALTREMSRSVDQLLSAVRPGYALLVDEPTTPTRTPLQQAPATPAATMSPSKLRGGLEQTIHATRLPVARELERQLKARMVVACGTAHLCRSGRARRVYCSYTAATARRHWTHTRSSPPRAPPSTPATRTWPQHRVYGVVWRRTQMCRAFGRKASDGFKPFPRNITLSGAYVTVLMPI